MKREINVIITGVGGNIAQGIIKSVRQSRLRCSIIGIDSNPLSAGLFVSDKAYVVPRVEDSSLNSVLKDIIRRESADIILVGSDPEIGFYAKHKNRIEKESGSRVVISDEEVVRIASDKYLTANFLKENGFSYVDSAPYADKEKLSLFIKKHRFPVIIKPRKGYGSANVFIVHSPDEIDILGRRIKDAVVQELVGDEESEYTVAVLYFKEADIFEHIIFKRELHSGTTYRAEVVKDKNITRQVRDIIKRLDPYGPCNIQCKYVNSKIVVFEMNPRFSGTTAMRSLVGFNDAAMTIEYVALKKIPRPPAIRHATILRYWNEMVVFESIKNLRVKKRIKGVKYLNNDSFKKAEKA